MGSRYPVIHYHGTPISPGAVIGRLAGRSFCVSFAAPQDVKNAHRLGQSVLLDNGAFNAWRQRRAVDWGAYYAWVEPWLAYMTTWAVIPDVIEGSVAENEALLDRWPFGTRGAPVWHMHEPVERLLSLAEAWPRVCVGSSAEYAVVGDAKWRRRMDTAFNALCPDGLVPVWLHMLRGMSLSGSEYPFASVDSTDVGRNHNRSQNDALEMALRWDGRQCAARWQHREQLSLV